MSLRVEKVNSLIKQKVSEILSRELSLKSDVFLTISKVDTTKDFRYTHIFISVFPEKDSDYAMKTLKKEVHSIQKSLNRQLHMKIFPRIQFKLDSTEVEANEIEKILKNISD